MQLGVSTYTFPWAVGVPGQMPAQPMSALALLHYAASREIGAVQFGDNLPLHTLSDDVRRQMQEVAASQKITIEVGTRRLTAETVATYLPLARQFGSPFLRMVIDDADYHPSQSEVIQVIQSLLPDFRQAQVILAIENHDRFPVASLERIIQVTDPEWVGVCLDTANSLGAGEGIQEVVSVLAPYTVNLHIKDFTIERLSHKMGFSVAGCPAGQGMLNIPWLIKEINKHQRCATATLEVWSSPVGNSVETPVDSQNDLQATIEREKAWAEASIHYLQTNHKL